MKITPLNFDWSFREGFDQSSIDQSFHGDQIHLPHSVKVLPHNYFDDSQTQGLFTYQKSFHYDLKPNRRLFLVCDGIMTSSTIYLNGKELDNHIGGYTQFRVELTKEIQSENILTIKVDTFEHKHIPPHGNVVDYLTYGGIYREIELYETGPIAIDHALIDGDHERLNIRVKFNLVQKKVNGYITIQDKDMVLHHIPFESHGKDLSISMAHQLELWSIENPKLYQFSIDVDGEEIYQSRFGVRSLFVDQDGFYLNHKKVFLRGLNRHQSYPYVGYAMPSSAQAKDADILKNELAVNIVRSSHYPPSKHFLNRCDEIGLLVFTELPGWQHLGDEEWKKQALKDLFELVIEGYNHPSIVMIGTRINESKDDDVFYQKTHDLVKSIDHSRPTGGVRNFPKSHLFEDIYTMNDFTHRGNNEGLTTKRKITSKYHPYLVTEHNGHMFPTKSFDHENIRVEQCKRHLKVLDDAYSMKGLMGVIGWCMNDYQTHGVFGSNNNVCYHGVLDMNRNPKYAAAVYASQGDQPFLEVLSMMHIGEQPGGELKSVMVLTNCDYVELYKGTDLIGKHYPSIAYPNLVHPPIIIDDFIGNQLEENESFSQKDAKRIKSIMLYMMRNNLKMRFIDRLIFGYLLIKYRLSYYDAVQLYTKYIGGWGSPGSFYEFKGYLNHQCVKVVKKGINSDYQLSLNLDQTTLRHHFTYDVSRCTIVLTNDFGERAFYTNATIEVMVSGDIELIGPSTRSLQGGIESFWIKSKKPGKGTILVKSNDYKELSIDITVL